MIKQIGLSIVEMMIGISIGIILIGGAGTFYLSSLKGNIDDVRQQRFEQFIQILKSNIVATIRRAGYSNSLTALPDVSGWTAGSHFYTNGTCAQVTYVDTTQTPAKQQYFGY